jgi:hypothetical protein
MTHITEKALRRRIRRVVEGAGQPCPDVRVNYIVARLIRERRVIIDDEDITEPIDVVTIRLDDDVANANEVTQPTVVTRRPGQRPH